MRYTQIQIREWLSISMDAFGAWLGAIPALALHKGHAHSFTPGDVVAMATVAELVKDFSARGGTVGNRFDALFKGCQGRSWLSLQNCVASIGAESFRLVDVDSVGPRSPDASTLNIPCAPVNARLRSVLTTIEADQVQGHLLFAPTSVATRPERRGTRA